MAGGKSCVTIELFKDLGDEVDVIRVNNDNEAKRPWLEAGYSEEKPEGIEEEEEGEESDEDEEGEESEESDEEDEEEEEDEV